MVEHYIPPFNQIDDNTLSALIKNKIKYVHSHCGIDNSIEGIIPTAKFYGRSTIIAKYVVNEFKKGDVLTLHLTWEQREKEILGKDWALPKILDSIGENLI
jgi:hypothetical protein